MAWPIVEYNGAPHYHGQGDFLIPVDPSTGMAVIMLRHDGGIGSGLTAIEKGDPGVPPSFDPDVPVTELAYDDPTPASGTWTQISPPTGNDPGLWQLSLTLHGAAPGGSSGGATPTPADFGGGTAGQVLAVNNAADEFEIVDQKIPEVFYPGEIDNVGSGNVNATLCSINIAARPWARRVRAQGYTVVTGEAADVRVDLVARLNNAGSGNIVGHCIGIASTERLMFAPGKPINPGTVSDTYDTIAAGESATLYVRLERKAGSSTYTASASASMFSAEVWPL
ncbi:minor tail protein [Mycobacterium phage MichelleMyBell]|uniref:Minor tail protein n=1 Tax=Mycobacterium phage MichelleMyBell TaxID=1445726 RepID=W0LK92_9CAUD|nr:minor tail protein [Mycobacterium phage MichelleMyBell]AHG24340.1 minor tail protein [Mycobacterium phage MichelleMyBell]